ncbi:MAG: hypothetical protein L3J34_03105 [Flavobacteriaceae bacterium]|nr:hypothetical protein [Flavobacteriaceae bacterium]
MKKIILIITAILFTNLSFAQDYSIEEVEIFQNLFGAEKKAIIEGNIDLTGVDANAFWGLYQEYETFRKEIGKKKLELLKQYTTKSNISNDQVESLMKTAIPLRKSEDSLIEKYYKKLKKSTSPIVAAQFYQIEHYISDGMRFAILNNIEFIQDKK